jgi:succinate dehydrogenase/fumarate reductase flavoprotein subunit
MKEEGIDFRKHPIEFQAYHVIPEGKVWINEKAETSVAGLYSAGDESMGGISCAAVYGMIAGENAASYAREVSVAENNPVYTELKEKKKIIQGFESRKNGPDWKEVNIALQQLMQDYAGVVRSESMLKAGLSYLRRMKRKVQQTMIARNRWELTRCLETLNLMDLGELILIAANERKETRALHVRTDYPLTDPVMDGKEIMIRKGKVGPEVEIKAS